MADVIFDKRDQLERIQASLLPGEEAEAVFDLKGATTGFLGITSKRVVFQDNNFLQRMKALVSIPYSRIHTIAAEDDAGILGARGFFGSSKIMIGTSSGEYEFEFRGADKGHQAHNMILERMLS
jgi:GRAM domain-containing protein